MTRPDQTRPDQTRPDQTRPDQTRPDQTRPALCFDLDLVTIPKTYEHSDENYSLEVWGNTWKEIPENLYLNDFTIDELQKLNFDGSYIALYKDHSRKRQLVFNGNIDALPFYYCIEGERVIFSDKFYILASRFKKLTIDRDSISDYFEGSWNHIAKYDRTPFREIRKLDSWHYMTSDGTVSSWQNLDDSIKFTERNYDDFKREFFECTDYYLKKIHDRYSRVNFSVSSGLDANTMAARYVQLYPDNDAVFYTSRIDDVTDEYPLASKMEQVLHKPVIPVDVEPDNHDFLELLKKYIDTNLPPRYYGPINSLLFCDELVKMNISAPIVSGFGADGRFGDFGGENFWFMRELISRFHFVKAFRTYKGILRSFSDYDYDKYGDSGILKKFIMVLVKMPLTKIKRIMRQFIIHHTNHKDFLKFSLPTSQSGKIRTHKEALDYAAQEGGLRDFSILYHEHGLKMLFPYAGYKFYQLSANCSPFIFSDGIGKACERYAVSDLLPPEIINNAKKSGLPSMTLKKTLNSNNNLANILNYIKGRESRLIDTEKLYSHFSSGNYDRYDFNGLCLLIFEEKLCGQMGIEIEI